MKIPSEDILQANTPDRAIKCIIAVGNGARTDKEIAKAIGNLDARQGRYYRRATEALGFITRIKGNASELTSLGNEFFNSPVARRNIIFIQNLLKDPVIQRLLPFLHSRSQLGVSTKELASFLHAVAEIGTIGTAQRRASTYITWLKYFGLIAGNGSNLQATILPDSAPILHLKSDSEPILPRLFALNEYEEQARRVRSAREAVSFYVNHAAIERATASHESLVNLMAQRLRNHGAMPKANRYVDLSARCDGVDYLFEMKSTTEDNPHAQIRRGISQLYEYRYIQNIPAAKLVLVIENPLPRRFGWLEDYLVQDRDVLLVWDGNGSFTCPQSVSTALPFLN
ncbi:MAG: AAA-associated domain-containing protein [Verrucomicrobia bacterium]|nr:AAA-associated domain-containing protein [Verrucomicrobiota bacterium]